MFGFGGNNPLMRPMASGIASSQAMPMQPTPPIMAQPQPQVAAVMPNPKPVEPQVAKVEAPKPEHQRHGMDPARMQGIMAAIQQMRGGGGFGGPGMGAFANLRDSLGQGGGLQALKGLFK